MSLPAPFDLMAGAIALLLILYGMIKGLVRMVTGFAGLVLGWILAVRYSEPLARRFGATAASGAPSIAPDWIRMGALALLFTGVVFGACLVGWLITRALGAAKLGGANRLAGAGLGLLVAMVLICAATVPVVAWWQPAGESLMRESLLAPYAVAGGQYLAMVAADPLASHYGAAARHYFGGAAAKPGSPGRMGGPSEPKPAPAPRPR